MIKLAFDSRQLREFVFYAAIGGIGTIFHYVVLVVLVELYLFKPLIGSSFGFLTGALINYTLNYYFVFSSKRSHRSTLLKFMVIASIGGVGNMLLFALLVKYSTLHYFLIQMICTALLLLFTYGFNKKWTF
jgi:putative flippase GtrA